MKLRIITIDYYLSKPHQLLDQCTTQFQSPEPNQHKPNDYYNSSNFKVPILRIFGVSQLGQKACLHIHQVLIFKPLALTLPFN